MKDSEMKKNKIVRYGLMVIPPIAWVVGFAPLFIISNGAKQDWVGDALIPSLIEAVVVGAVCIIVWSAYRRAESKA